MKLTSYEFNKILSKLERNTSGKIIEKIQIYTHSRGAAFGQGYTQKLLEFIKQNASEFHDSENVIDFSYNMAPNESWGVSSVPGIATFSHNHKKDWLSGNRMSGVTAAFTSKEGSGGLIPSAHKTGSFTKNLNSFLKAFQAGKTQNSMITEFINDRKSKYNITVTVTQ